MANQKLVNLFLVGVALIAAFILIKPFLTALAFAAVIAFMLYKPYRWLSAKTGKNFAAGILASLVLTFIIAAIFFGVQALLNEFANIYVAVSKIRFENLFASSEVTNAFQDLTRLVLQKVIESLTSIIYSVPKILLSLFIFTVSVFFFLRDGPLLYNWLKKAFPLPAEKKEHMFKDLKRYGYSFILVWFSLGLLQGFVAALGFWLLKLPAPLLAGLVAAILSILPVIGVYALYIPAGIILFLRGEFNAAISILLYGLVIGSVLDYVIRPYLTGKWASMHPLLILVGMLSGVLVLGPAGFVIGPAALVVIVAILHGTSFNHIRYKQ